MSSPHFARSEAPIQLPNWLAPLLGVAPMAEGGRFSAGGDTFVIYRGIPRAEVALSPAQAQTRDAFGFIWDGPGRFESGSSLTKLAQWYRSHYGDVANAKWWSDYGPDPLLVDAGCGAGISALGLFGERLRSVRYLGVDLSCAVDAAARRFGKAGIEAAFLQTSLTRLPLADGCVDVMFAQGTLHHTDSTEAAIGSVARKLKPGGRLLFYVYRRKGPLREFTDDDVRAKLQRFSLEESWRQIEPLTRLGIALGEIKQEIDIPEPIEVLGIPAGRIDVQRLFYQHVCKVFYDPDLTFDEMNHINLDWFAPANAHRQSPEEVRDWCQAAGLKIEHEHLQESGITIIARKEGV
jgi:arsenite methyltransferase